jgi:multidrug transporter EmrE-like cation transporter
MNQKLKKQWYFIVGLVLFLTVLTFSPWVLKTTTEPLLLDMPYTLWMSIVTTVLVIVCTIWGGRVFKKMKNK